MSLNTLQHSLLPRIELGLKDLLKSQDFGRSQALSRMLTYHMGWENEEGQRGKRIRPLLALLCAGAFGAKVETAMPAAVAIELLHNFTLIHDDIQDNSPLRHGRPTLWTKWGPAQAINAGDALFSIAQIAMLGLRETRSSAIAAQAMLMLNQVCLHLTRGQYLDIAFETENSIKVETYMDMIEGKTAALIGLSAALGGLAAGKDNSVTSSLYDFGKWLGIAFQIKDDYLGIWGDTRITGKSTTSDLQGRKKTLPVLLGLNICPEFQKLWEMDVSSDDHINLMAEKLSTCGVEDHVRTLAEEYTKNAFLAMASIFPNSEDHNKYASGLFELSNQLLQREY